MRANDGITKGLEEALLFAEGQKAGTRIHKISVLFADAAEIRRRTEISQAQFAEASAWRQAPS